MSNPKPRIDFPLPAEYTVAKCHSCKQRIVWIQTGTGKAMPLDLRSQIDGRCESHFAHCPNARQHRRQERQAERRQRGGQ